MQYRHASTATIPGRRMAPLPRRRTMLERPVRMRAILEELRWRRPSDGPQIVTIADVAECGCPDWCLRDHENE